MDLAQNAPDEIIENILHHALVIPSETFEAWRKPHDFVASPRYDIWNPLLTSSRWYRVGLPLLYESAILRTAKQVTSFARAILRCDENGRLVLARCVRRLRMEATYCFSFENILDACRGSIRVLYLSLDVSDEDDFFGLAMALGKVNPSRLILTAGPAKIHPESGRWLGEAICEAAPAWTNLKRIDFGPDLAPIEMLVQFLVSLPQVEHVSMNYYHSGLSEYNMPPEAILRPFLARRSLKVLQIRDGRRWLESCLAGWPYRNRRIVLGEGTGFSLGDIPKIGTIAASASRLLDDLPDDIWSRILGYATHIHGYNYLDMDLIHRWSVTSKVELSIMRRTRMSVILVCWKFLRLGLPHMYAFPILYTWNLQRFLSRLQSPDLAKLVRVISVRSGWGVRPTITLTAPLVNLVSVDDSVRFFSQLIRQTPPGGGVLALESMREHLWRSDVVTPTVFLALPRLRHLVLRGGRDCRVEKGSHVDLPNLEILELYDPGDALTTIFRNMGLPRLREFGFDPSAATSPSAWDFLQVHGDKISVLSLNTFWADDNYPDAMFDLCPNITELRLLSHLNPFISVPFLSHSQLPLRKLQRVVIILGTGAGHLFGHPCLLQQYASFAEYLRANRSKLPVFNELRAGGIQWPQTKAEYYGCLRETTRIAHALLAVGIHLADKDGTRWTRMDPLRHPTEA